MKTIPLRKRYFRDVMWLGGLVLGLSLLVLTLFNAVEVYEHAEERIEELIEMGVLAAVLLGTLPVVVWMAWRTSGRLLRPLRDIQEGVRAMREGEMGVRLKVENSRDELAYLAESLNAAFDAHRDAQRRLDDFASNVSHQLRTPLTAMRATGQVCLDQDRDAESYQDCIGCMLEASERLTHMVDQLLQLARISALDAAQDLPRVDLKDLLVDVCAPFAEQAQDRGAELDMQIPQEPLMVRGNKVWLQEALVNLLNNAMAYTPDPARIKVSLTAQDGWVCCRIDDNGPGVASDVREKLFMRFQRGLSRQDGGTGLGLAIVAEVVTLHGGTVKCEESVLGGAAFEFSFPQRVDS
ncbi:HAMP domain-containing sensor histidine kinase [Kiritimatiellaeota bacterium B1221]|nr:HAMP domain-containing sensor histidine kinase [Kiritimatiellaeota bacterium B1221]